MSNTRTITGRISAYKRMCSSINGNPRFRGFIQDVRGVHTEWRTRVDCMCGFGIQNYIGTDTQVTLELDPKGNVLNVQELAQ